jgi:transposase InsO family protein
MTTLSAPADDDPHQRRALARFAAVQMVLQARQRGLSLYQALHQAAQEPWDGRHYSPATIEHWLYRYEHGQFAALHNQPRSDKGTQRALDSAAAEALFVLRRQHPELTIKNLVAELLRQGVLQPGTYSDSTIQRRLIQAGLDRKSLQAGAAPITGPTKAFELPLPNLLWMADCMHGPTLKLSNGKALRTYLFALLDDCSRLCVHAQFYPAERIECFLHCLRLAIQSRGLPDKLYTDNGATFRSQHLAVVCANLRIRLLHAKPYHSWSKGKVERYFLTLQSQFLPTLVFRPVQSLEELNARLWPWIETEYHQREHSSLSGQSPAQRFHQGAQTIRSVSPELDLDRLFLMRLARRVRKDATISLGGALWEVPTHLRGLVITLHFDPIQWTRVEVWMGDRFIGNATRCNKHLNSQTFSSNDYDRNLF